jgi:phosphoribosyl 1,2-cyclic phosphate phosphodiesterase
MEILFLGTGGAWGLPEHQCPCATCTHLRQIGEYRTRTSLWVEAAGKKVLIDPGPDLRQQLMREDLAQPDVVLVTHEHGDHYLGLDDLLCYRRNMPVDDWSPIPVYATEAAWEQIEVRFGYLLGSLLEKRFLYVGEEAQGGPFGENLFVVPVKTDHGPFAKGSVGYIVGERKGAETLTMGYTSDMTAMPDPGPFKGLDLLVCQSQYFNEPKVNRANHLSLHNALPYLESWQPGEVWLVHLSCQDYIPGDEAVHNMQKKMEPGGVLKDPSGQPYAIPQDHASWQKTVERVFKDQGLNFPVQVAFDGVRVPVRPCPKP